MKALEIDEPLAETHTTWGYTKMSCDWDWSGSEIYDRTLALFRGNGFEPKMVSTATMPYEDSGAILVDSGKGIYVAVGNNPIHPSFVDRLISLPLAEPSAISDVYIVWRKDEQARLILDFVQFTKDKFQHDRSLTRDRNHILERSRADRLRARSSSRQAVSRATVKGRAKRTRRKR